MIRKVISLNTMEKQNISYAIPEDAEAISAVQDGDRAFIFGFKSHRKVFSQLGFIMVPEDDHVLRSCAEAMCDIIYMEALLKIMTLSPQDILAHIDTADSEAAERNAAMVLTAARQAVTDYAGKLEK